MAEASDKYYDALDEMIGKIKDARESMRMEGMAYAQMKSAQGQIALQTVLEQARQGNFANVDTTNFSDIASRASSTALFATRQDYQANYWKTYNQMSELEKIIGGEIPIAEQQLNVQKLMLDELRKANGEEPIYYPENAGTQPTRESYYGPLTGAIDYPAYAEGGISSGGWRVTGENGPELEFALGPSRIFSNRDSKALVDNSELIAEVKALREDLNAIGYAVARNTGKSAKVLDRFDQDGLPPERT
jgi:hypothetical protein